MSRFIVNDARERDATGLVPPASWPPASSPPAQH